MNLLEAVHRVDVPRVAVLLSQGADVNVTDSQGVTPLIIACERGELRMVDLLLEANASTKLVTNDTQSSCLHIAAKSNAADIVQRLLTVDRSLEEKTNCQGDTALMLACLGAEEKTKSMDTLKALLQPLDSTPTNSNTANKLTVEPSTTTTRNGTPGRGKTSKRSLSVPATSTSNGSNTSEGEGVPYLGPDDPRLRVRNRHGHTVLHIATFTHSPTAVRMLLEAGADCTVVDKTGRTAMQAALNIVRKGGGQREGFDTCLKLLQQRWEELERESKEREMLLLGELDVAGALLGAGKVVAGKKSAAGKAGKRKKKSKAKASLASVTPPSLVGGGAAGEGGGGSVSLTQGGDSCPPQTAVDTVEAGHGQVSSSSTVASGSATSSAPGSSQEGDASQDEQDMGRKREAGSNAHQQQKGTDDGSSPGTSDTEGETDDEVGSHPSSEEADGATTTGPGRDAAGGGMTSAAGIGASIGVAEGGTGVRADSTSARGGSGAGTSGEEKGLADPDYSALRNTIGEIDSVVDGTRGRTSELGRGLSPDGREVDASYPAHDEESWSVVARPRKKKGAARGTRAMPKPPVRRKGGGTGAAPQDTRIGQRVFSATDAGGSRRGVAVSERGGGVPAGRDEREKSVVSAPAATRRVGRQRSQPTSAAASTPGSVAVAPSVQSQVQPSSASLPARPPSSVSSSSVSPSPGVEATAKPVPVPPPPASVVSQPPPSATDKGAISSAGGTSAPNDGPSTVSSSAPGDIGGVNQRPPNQPRQRPLNVNADAWTPSPPPPPQQQPLTRAEVPPHLQRSPLLPPYVAHPCGPSTVQQQHQQDAPRMNQVTAQGSHQTPPSFSEVPPMPPQRERGVAAGQTVALHLNSLPAAASPPMMMHSSPAPPPPPPPPRVGGPWGHHGNNHPPPPLPPLPLAAPNSFIHHPGAFVARAGGGDSGSMITHAAPHFPPQHAINNLEGRPGGAVNGAMAGILPTAPDRDHRSSSPVPSSPSTTVARVADHGAAGVLSRAQAMLEASSPQAAVVALKVEHLVWDVEAMRAGLSMGQLDTVKAYLLEQLSRIDEAKLELVRAQERCKSEEQSNIMQNLQQHGVQQVAADVDADADATSNAEATSSAVGAGGGDGDPTSSSIDDTADAAPADSTGDDGNSEGGAGGVSAVTAVASDEFKNQSEEGQQYQQQGDPDGNRSDGKDAENLSS